MTVSMAADGVGNGLPAVSERDLALSLGEKGKNDPALAQ